MFFARHLNTYLGLLLSSLPPGLFTCYLTSPWKLSRVTDLRRAKFVLVYFPLSMTGDRRERTLAYITLNQTLHRLQAVWPREKLKAREPRLGREPNPFADQ